MITPNKLPHIKNGPLYAAALVVGGRRKLAVLLGVSHQRFYYWEQHKTPAEYVIKIEKLSGIKREVLRPDLEW